MTSIITDLQNAYPDARIIILSAGYIQMYKNGAMAIENYSAPLQTYRDLAAQVASERGCELLSLTDDFGFYQEGTPFFLNDDLVHYNERGRYQIAQGLARYFK
jgi:lysophospholipase L1-like esterase